MGKEKDDKNKIEIVSAGAEPGTGGGPVKREESREQQRNEQYNPVSYTHLTLPTICSV